MSRISYELFSLQEHDDADVIDAEHRAQGHRDLDDAADLLIARGRDAELVADQHLVLHHLGEEAVYRGAQGAADALVVEPADERIGGGTDAERREVDDPPGGDLAKGGVG